MIHLTNKLRKKIRNMIELEWSDLPDKATTDKFVDKLIKTIQNDFWNFMKEDLEVTINKLIKG